MDGDPTPALTGRRRTRPTSAGPGLLQSAAAIRGSLNPAGLHLSQRTLLFRQTEPPLCRMVANVLSIGFVTGMRMGGADVRLGSERFRRMVRPSGTEAPGARSAGR